MPHHGVAGLSPLSNRATALPWNLAMAKMKQVNGDQTVTFLFVQPEKSPEACLVKK